MRNPNVPLSLIVPGLPQPLLAPEACESWARVRHGFERARELVAEAVEREGADVLFFIVPSGLRSSGTRCRERRISNGRTWTRSSMS